MKKRALSLLLTLLALAGLLSAAGCSLGRSPRPDFYMLSSPAENSVLSGKEKNLRAARRHRPRSHSGLSGQAPALPA